MTGLVHIDGASRGLPAPTRRYGKWLGRAAE
jgi:hypothetical protein